jgi:ribosomal protein S18 acetylase RimI-like enzyme
MTITVRRFVADEWRMYRDLRLRALADSPDAFGSTYEREAARAEEDWKDRLAAAVEEREQMPVVALDGTTPVGLAWGRVDEGDAAVAHLFQVWVAPEHRARGVGRSLTDAVIAWARDLGVRTLRLGVTPSHPAALRLYRGVGFVDVGQPEALRPGSSVTCQPMQMMLEGVPHRSTDEH